MQARDPPSTYLNKLKTYLDPKASKSSKKIRDIGDTNSTQVLRNLEISLRTNNIEWVRVFLSEESQGLNVLIEYLNSRLQLMRHKLAVEKNEKNMDTLGNNVFLRQTRSKKFLISKTAQRIWRASGENLGRILRESDENFARI